MVAGELIDRALNGDAGAWTQIVRDFSPMIFSIALSSTRNLHDAQDIVQEAFLRAYLYLGSLDDKGRFPGWLRQIAENLCRSRARRKKWVWLPLQETESSAVVAGKEATPFSSPAPFIAQSDAAVAAFEAREIVNKALCTLSKKLRETAALHYLKELDCAEIADELALPEGTVKRRLHDARQTLKREVIQMTSENVILKYAVGLETTGKRHTPIFVKGLHLPVSWTKMFSTAEDNQKEIIVHVLQGDSDAPEACRSVAALKITGFESGQKRREPRLWLTFRIDRAGQFYCDAVEAPDRALAVHGEASRIETEVAFTGYDKGGIR